MNSAWTVLALAIVILVIELVTAGWNETLLLALLVLVILGAIFPPFGIMFAAVILLYLLLTRSKPLFDQFTPKGGKTK